MGAAPQQISPDQRVGDFRKIFAARGERSCARDRWASGRHPKNANRAVLRRHILIEGVPGLGKTLMVKAASETLGLSFKRIQFTPDLMPSDIIGTQVLTERKGIASSSSSRGRFSRIWCWATRSIAQRRRHNRRCWKRWKSIR